MHREPKPHLSHDDQLRLLESRGLVVDDRAFALSTLRRINYYRLSAYWHPFLNRSGPEERFRAGVTFTHVLGLYRFDQRLRVALFSALTEIEIAIRTRVGHELGREHPCLHLDPTRLGPRAFQRGTATADYVRWRESYDRAVDDSKDEFVAHHRSRYGGRLPVWVAVELLDWGALTRLLGFAPREALHAVADGTGLNGIQMHSVMRSLNILRNRCAHHARVVNRPNAIAPKLPRSGEAPPSIEAIRGLEAQPFGQVTLVLHLLETLGLDGGRLLRAVVLGYPAAHPLPIEASMKAPEGWPHLPLWRSGS